MATTFLQLVNQVNRRLNEVELTSTNFASATGFYAHAKDAVNASIRYINQSEFEWPFNHTTQNQTLTANTSRYSFPTDCKVINFDTFRIQENSTIGSPSNSVEGAIISIEVAQHSSSGPYTLAWNAVFEFVGDETPTQTATDAKTDIYAFRYNGSKWQNIGISQNLTQS